MPDFVEGDVIVPRAHLRNWIEWGLVVDEVRATGAIVAHPAGGGFEFRFSPERSAIYDFVKVPEDLLRNPTWYSAEFYAEWIEKAYVGWTTGERWNGWATPHFEFDEAMRYARDAGNTRYDRLGHAFITDIEGWDEPEIDQALVITVPDRGRLTVYPIGSGSWTWSEVKRVELEEGGSVKDWRPPY
jgi:hypothetical protein